ncbi:MAG: TorF family putative porin [Gallionellaceae bacterium]|jgi:uncharacterized protein (TIGR02001 family)|nr:TorF family putative porin [Gallionellaceae bacterium]
MKIENQNPAQRHGDAEKSIVRLSLCLCVSVVSGFLPMAASADSGWSGNISVVSTYVSRGFNQTWSKPALQAGVEYNHDDGWFVGTWGSNVSPYFIEGGSLEWDTYAGYRGQHEKLAYEAGLYYYRYPGARINATGTRYDYGEAIVKVGLYGVDVSYALTVTPDYFGFNSDTLGQGRDQHSRGSGYLSVDGSVPLGEDFSLGLHYGHQSVRHFSDYNWSDGKLSLDTAWHGFDVSLAYTRAWDKQGAYAQYTTGVPDSAGNVRISDPTKGRVFLSVGRGF